MGGGAAGFNLTSMNDADFLVKPDMISGVALFVLNTKVLHAAQEGHREHGPSVRYVSSSEAIGGSSVV